MAKQLKDLGMINVSWWDDFNTWIFTDPVTHSTLTALTFTDAIVKLTNSRRAFGVSQ